MNDICKAIIYGLSGIAGLIAICLLIYAIIEVTVFNVSFTVTELYAGDALGFAGIMMFLPHIAMLISPDRPPSDIRLQ